MSTTVTKRIGAIAGIIALAGASSGVFTDNAVPKFTGADGALQNTGVLIGDTDDVRIPQNNTTAALTLTTPNPGTVTYDSTPIAALKIEASSTTRNFEAGLWVLTNGSAIDKGRGILLQNLGASDGLYIQTDGVNGTGFASHLTASATNATGGVISTLLSTHSGLVIRQETSISATANCATLLHLQADGAATEMMQIGSSKASQVGLIFRFSSGSGAAPIVVRDTADSGTVFQVNNSGQITASLVAPISNDGAALGTTSLQFSDLFLASGAVINFNSSNMTVTHSANALTIGGASSPALRITDGTVTQQFSPSGGAIGYVGTTSNHPLGIIVNNAEKWRFQTDGVVLPLTDNSFDIGAGSFRPRDVYCSRDLFRPGGTQALIRTSAGITSGAGASTGTLTNAPSAGNPTSWVPINDNGTTRYLPAW